ncbi:MAG: hypothetical protein U1E56_09435 [Bauldia sp.]
MRFIFGIVVGALLTIAGAYVHDSNAAPGADLTSRPLVNWEVAGAIRDAGVSQVRQLWARVVGQ